MSQLYCTGRAASALELKPSINDTPDLTNDVPAPEIIDGDREELPERSLAQSKRRCFQRFR